ncbi:MAG: hypothetical protein AAF447_06555 [Myxococcota bacterium]
MRAQLFGEGMLGYLGSFRRVEDMELHGLTLRFAVGLRVPRAQGPAFVASAVVLYPIWVRMRAFDSTLPTSNPGYITVWPPLGVSLGISWGSGTLGRRARRGW